MKNFPKNFHDWPIGAQTLTQSVPLEKLDGGVVALLQSVPLDSAGTIAVACSGGVDSLAALLLVWAHFPALRGRFVVLNFNHGTRRECDAEARFVACVSDSIGEKFQGGKIKCSENSDTSEATLRRHRLAFFSEAMRTHQCRILVQGHQAGDVAETMLMRLARGSGTAGLAAPRPVHRFSDGRIFVRPLLSVEKKVLIEAMHAANLPWCEDASNDTGDYLRNRIRRDVMPAWYTAQGTSVPWGVLRSRQLLGEDDEALEKWAEPLWPLISVDTAETGIFDWRSMTGLPRAIHRRIFWRVLLALSCGEALSAAAVDAILDSLEVAKPGRWSVAENWLAFDGNTLSWVTAPDAPMLSGSAVLLTGGLVFWSTGGCISAENMLMPSDLFAAICGGAISPDAQVFLAADSIVGNLQVRCWELGDAYHALGAPGARKLSDVFVDKKIPKAERHRLPVVCDERGIIWVPGLPPAERCRLLLPSALALRLTWGFSPVNFFSPYK